MTSSTHLRIEEARQLFPGAEQNIYLNVSVRGLLSTPVREAADAYLDEHLTGEWDKQALFDTV